MIRFHKLSIDVPQEHLLIQIHRTNDTKFGTNLTDISANFMIVIFFSAD